jgi:hypothetical protein
VKLNANVSEFANDITMYRYIIRSLVYKTIMRPNLNYAISIVNQFM